MTTFTQNEKKVIRPPLVSAPHKDIILQDPNGYNVENSSTEIWLGPHL